MATFGYTSVGGSQHFNAANLIYGSWHSLPETGDITSMTVSMSNNLSGVTFATALYLKTSNAKVGQTTTRTIGNTSLQWQTFVFASDPTLSPDDYWLAFCRFGGGTSYLRYDTSSSKGFSDDTGQTLPSTLSPSTTNNLYSFYATYTAADSPPTVTTQAVSSITKTTATGNGNVTSDGGAAITERGVCWATTATPTTANSKATSAGTTGAFTASITGLTEGTTYYVRAYAINAEGTSYGAEVEFDAVILPTVVTHAVTNIAET